ncbi:hypothetical protein HYX12_00085 [Candidatus Woesearchaeota archaeon]|nr:hypothetical protein [Candidatus Woesearchaeota archaeon]
MKQGKKPSIGKKGEDMLSSTLGKLILFLVGMLVLFILLFVIFGADLKEVGSRLLNLFG